MSSSSRVSRRRRRPLLTPSTTITGGCRSRPAGWTAASSPGWSPTSWVTSPASTRIKCSPGSARTSVPPGTPALDACCKPRSCSATSPTPGTTHLGGLGRGRLPDDRQGAARRYQDLLPTPMRTRPGHTCTTWRTTPRNPPAGATRRSRRRTSPHGRHRNRARAALSIIWEVGLVPNSRSASSQVLADAEQVCNQRPVPVATGIGSAADTTILLGWRRNPTRGRPAGAARRGPAGGRHPPVIVVSSGNGLLRRRLTLDDEYTRVHLA